MGVLTTPLGTGLRYLHIPHEGNRQDSSEEVEAVRRQVGELLAAGVTDLMVVAPYNAQVNALREALPETVRVGTVDKFQGQEAPVVFYSTASSSGEEIPRGLEFLFSRNRLNVAVSRAKHTAFLVHSPGLLDDLPRTPDGVGMLSGFARLVGHD